MLILLALAAAHTPSFEYDGGVLHSEPSIAIYVKHTKTFRISFKKDATIYAVVMQPANHDTPIVINNENCDLGPEVDSDHAKVYESGDTFYEPWAETVYTVVKTVWPGNKSLATQTCNFTVTADGPYVVATGTKEEILDMWLVGVPYYAIQVSLWAGTYTYGYQLLAWLFFAAILGACAPHHHGPTFFAYGAAAVLMTTASARVAQAIYFKHLGSGLLFALVPLFISSLVIANYKAGHSKGGAVVCTVLILLSPFRSWIDVLVSIAYTISCLVVKRSSV